MTPPPTRSPPLLSVNMLLAGRATVRAVESVMARALRVFEAVKSSVA